MRLLELVERHRTGLLTAAAVAPLAVCALLAAIRPDVPAATAVLLLVLVVVGAASTGVRSAGLLAAVSSGVWFDFFLTTPYHNLTVDNGTDVEATVLLVLIGTAVTEVALWGRRQEAHAERQAGYLDGVLGTAEIAALSEEAPSTVTDHVADQLRQVLEVTRCAFVPGRVRDPRIPVLDHRGQLTRAGRVLDVDRDGLPTDDSTALEVVRGDRVLGHFLLTSASDVARPTLQQRRVAVLLADQAGSALAGHGGLPGAPVG